MNPFIQTNQGAINIEQIAEFIPVSGDKFINGLGTESRERNTQITMNSGSVHIIRNDIHYVNAMIDNYYQVKQHFLERDQPRKSLS